MKLLIIASLYLYKLVHCFPQSLVAAGGGVASLPEVGDVARPPSDGVVPPLKITKFHVDSKIQFRYARTQVTSHIKNPGTAPNQADFTMVLPDSAFISNFSMIIRDVEYVAQVKEKEEAKATFDEAVSLGRGAGIINKDIRDSNIFTVTTNIEPGAKVIFKLTYEELLERNSGKYEHFINIDPKQLVDDLKVEVFINESLPISSIFVPELIQSNEIDFIGSGENTIAEIEKNVDGFANNARVVFPPDKSYQQEAGAQGISGQFLVQYDVDRQGRDSEVQVIDGYFVHYFVPDNLETMDKHAVFVLDISGSMGGEKIEQLKDSMFTVLDDMTETDYFNIITFSSSVEHWSPSHTDSDNFEPKTPQVIQATEENKNLAIKHILGLQAGGGTNINEAMLEGLKIAEGGLKSEKLPGDVRPMIIFLTDGLLSSGETNNEAIKRNIKEANRDLDFPIFSIGFGRDLDFTLIKEISEQANSFSKRIYEGSDAALQLEDFFAQISSPLISNLKFDYVGGLIQNNSISQSRFKTYFKGGEYIIAGKLDQYTEEEGKSLTIGIVGDSKQGQYKRDIMICLRKPQEQDSKLVQGIDSSFIPKIPPPSCLFPPHYPPKSLAQDFMQKLHAFINIKQLIRKADFGEENDKNENKEKALMLALNNNFVTDLTSLVVVRPDEEPVVSSLKYPNRAEEGILPLSISSFASFNPGVATRNRVSPAGSFGYGYSAQSGLVGINRAPSPTFKRKGGGGILSLARYPTTSRRNIFTTATYRPVSTTTTTYPSVAYSYDISYDYGYDDYEAGLNTTTAAVAECSGSGNLTLFSKTYLRGEQVVVEDEETDLENISFDNLAVSASVSGSCCWQVFSGQNFTGSILLLSSQGTYTSVSSLGQLFRDVSSV